MIGTKVESYINKPVQTSGVIGSRLRRTIDRLVQREAIKTLGSKPKRYDLDVAALYKCPLCMYVCFRVTSGLLSLGTGTIAVRQAAV